MTTYWCEWAWLGGDAVSAGVVLDVDGDRFASIGSAPTAPAGAIRLDGVTLPGLVNGHSHGFHRALRGRTHGGEGSFWTWRQQMYALAETLDPDRYQRLARATFGEMALAGITTVGEFHYLHHGPGGEPYDEPNAMGLAMMAAAAEAGVRLTLIDACYLHGGIGVDLDPVQRRFGDGSVEAWASRVADLVESPTVRVGAAVHSVRALTPPEVAELAEASEAQRWLVHAHVSEQPAENEECHAAYGATPTQVLANAGVIGPSFTAVHAIHLTPTDRHTLAAGSVCVCPTTERDLADGIMVASAVAAAGARVCLGTDSNAVIDLFEEARAVELDERLATGRRGQNRSVDLLRAATEGGADSLGWPDGGRLAPGMLADFVTVGLGSVRLAGARPVDAVDAVESLVFSATAADVGHVVVGGRVVVRDGHHVTLDVAAELTDAIGALDP